MGIILLILLILIVIGSAPYYPHSQNWGYYPSGIAGFLILVLLLLLIFQVIPVGFTWHTADPVPARRPVIVP